MSGPEAADMAVRALVTAFSWLIWIGVASVIIYYIFTMAMTYINTITSLTREMP